jgi:pimeloyl-ACP methyl ester carboxylesterase
MIDAAPTTAGKFADANGVKIHYYDLGAGDPIVCLHGAGPGANAWSNFNGNVAALGAGHRVLLVDLPQYGKSAMIPVAAPALTNLARIIRDFLDAIGLRRVAFVGNSFGGQVALKVAIDYPERVSHVVMIGSAPVNHSLFCPQPVEAIKLIADYYKDEGPSLAKMRKILTTLVFDASAVTDAIVAERYEASIEPEAVRVHTLPRAPKQELTAELKDVKARTLVVWGMDDRAGALDVGLFMTRMIPNAQMHIFGKCGHWAQVEHADDFNDIVLSFLERE